MLSLSFSQSFKSFLSQQEYAFKATNLAGIYEWIQTNLPVIIPVLFDHHSKKIKPFICILRNKVQIDCNDLMLQLHSGDKIEILLPLSGG